MTATDTAHIHWSRQWADIQEDSKWLKPEADVIRWADGLETGAKLLDLGAGVGRHALLLNHAGFDVTALDAAPEGLDVIRATSNEVECMVGKMDDLPFADASFDHILSWNVIYHGDEKILRKTISEISRILKPGGTFLLTMLSKRRLPHEQATYEGHEVSRNAWVFDDGGKGDKRHPHYFCNATELLELFDGFEVLWLEDREHEKPGSWHWHAIFEKAA